MLHLAFKGLFESGTFVYGLISVDFYCIKIEQAVIAGIEAIPV